MNALNVLASFGAHMLGNGRKQGGGSLHFVQSIYQYIVEGRRFANSTKACVYKLTLEIQYLS